MQPYDEMMDLLWLLNAQVNSMHETVSLARQLQQRLPALENGARAAEGAFDTYVQNELRTALSALSDAQAALGALADGLHKAVRHG